MSDYERGVEQASAIYKEVIREYVDENAKLREERDHWRVEQMHAYGNWEDTYKRASELKAENVKLRNLIELMRSCPGDKGECDECRRLNDGCEVERLSRELGIEVD